MKKIYNELFERKALLDHPRWMLKIGDEYLFLKSFGNKSKDLAKAVAKMCKVMCSKICNYQNNWNIEAFFACTLVPLDKSPGVRPIGIVEVPRTIVRKVIMNK